MSTRRARREAKVIANHLRAWADELHSERKDWAMEVIYISDLYHHADQIERRAEQP